MFSTGEGNWRFRVAGTIVVAAIGAFGHAGVAGAQELTMCQSRMHPAYDPADPAPFQRMLAQQRIDMEAMAGAATTAVGAQYGNLWVNDAREGWSVAIAPGPLDVAAAKAAIVQQLQARFTPEQAEFVTDRLSVWPTLYPYAELQTIAHSLFDALRSLDQGWGWDAGPECIPAESGDAIDAYRVEATLYTGDVDPTPELVAQAHALTDPYGDKVRVTVKKGSGIMSVGLAIVPAPIEPAPPAPAPAPAAPKPAAPRIASYVSLPKASRCVRGGAIGVKARTVADLSRVRVSTRARTVSLRPGKRTRLRLTGKRTKVTLAVTTRDGRTASQTLTFRRCG